MSNFIKATDFSVKDGLNTGDPDKRIKGTEIDDEFDAIAVAIATKADLTSPAFLGVPTAPTASPGNNTTQIATTAFTAAAITAATGSLGTMSTQDAGSVAITGGSITGITDITVTDGGTGVSSIAANNVVLGNGTAPVQVVAPGSSGNVLTSNGSTWSSAAPSFSTSNFTGANQSLSSNGYQKIPGGLTIQWGYIASGTATQTVTFPVSFSNAVYSIQTTPIVTDGKRGSGVISGSVSLSGFQLVSGEGGVGNQYFPHYWIAIGS